MNIPFLHIRALSTKKRFYIRLMGIAIILFVLVMFLDLVVFPLPKEMLTRKPAHFIYSRDGQLLNCFSSSDHFWRKPVRLEEISPALIETVIAYEDKWFYYHPGVNPVSIISAAWSNIKEGKVVRGGSTITMQIARMMEARPRTIGSKVIEICRSFQLEWHFSKDELLEYYFNLVPYGGNIEGVGAATYFYFEKEPLTLSLSEAAILTAIPPSPNNFRPDMNPETCRKRRDRVLNYLVHNNCIQKEEYTNAVEEEIPLRRFERPFYAPHLSQTLQSDYPENTELNTTIDFNKQLLCERLAHRHYLACKSKGINNLAVVVLDNTSGELLAAVGSPDFTDVANGGQINGTISLRSPGSALKPFAYALGFDKGLLTSSTMLEDIPVSYSGYSPENYDEEYHGLVSVHTALVQSLNVPAVNLCAQVGLKDYYTLLRNGGISSLNRKYYEYGLPLVLGACEVSLLELSNLYSTLGRQGEYLPVTILSESSKRASKRILSAEACYLTTNILSNLGQPSLPSSWEFTKDVPTVAWKTGTSYGRKDAWAIGYNPDYTIGVWVGNFSAEGSPYLVGAETAAPLMLSIFHELTAGEEIKWFEMPPELETRTVCAVSGMLPTEHCQTTREELYIYGVSPASRCTVHKPVLVDTQTGCMLCPACSFGAHIDTLVIENWSVKLSSWLLRQGQSTPLPKHNPACMALAQKEAPVIHSPEKNGVYELRNSSPLEFQKLRFKASVSLTSSDIHWFLDDTWYATTKADEQLFYLPEKGKHTLLCMDDFGRSSEISFVVR